MKCPKCNHEQVCPCQTCFGRRLKAGDSTKPWIWIKGEKIRCSNCGLTGHADWWLDKELEEYIKQVNKEVFT